MTVLEAIETIKIAIAEVERNYPMGYAVAFETAISALEKQTPKKPTHEATLYRCLTCPDCKNVIDEFAEFVPGQPKIRIEMPNCKYCGQALDWSDSK